MKLLEIGDTSIVVSHITHFEFTPAFRSEPDRSSGTYGTEAPALLYIYVDGDKKLLFRDNQAEEANKKLKEIFS